MKMRDCPAECGTVDTYDTNCRHRSTGQKKKRKTRTTWQRIMKIVTVVTLNARAVVIVQNRSKKNSTRMGFEPTRAEPNGLAVHRLNHSATSSDCTAGLLRTNTAGCFHVNVKCVLQGLPGMCSKLMQRCLLGIFSSKYIVLLIVRIKHN